MKINLLNYMCVDIYHNTSTFCHVLLVSVSIHVHLLSGLSLYIVCRWPSFNVLARSVFDGITRVLIEHFPACISEL